MISMLFNIYNIYIKGETRMEYIAEKSKDNKNILRMKKYDEIIYIGNKYSVQEDIKEFKCKIKKLNKETIFIVFGVACGEHILELIKITRGNNKILILEPDENIIYVFNKLPCANRINKNRKISIICYKNNQLSKVLDNYIEVNNINNIELIDFANYSNLYSNQFNDIGNAINEKISNLAIELNFFVTLSDQHFTCFINNIEKVIKSTLINDFKNKFVGKPAIVVSAGPSLEKNINLLKTASNKFLIFVGGRTLKTLLDIGVKPDFVCVVDPGQTSYDVIKDSLYSDVPLVFNELTNYKVVEEYKGKKIFFTDPYLKGITSEIIEYKVDELYQGGSVAHVCTSFASYLGCNEIVFIGQDLAYTNNKCHADMATISTDEKYHLAHYKSENVLNDMNSDTEEEIFTEDINGGMLPTSSVFLYYKKFLEKFIEESSNIHFINSTEGGANIIGTEVKKLNEVIEEHNEIIDKDAERIFNTKIKTDVIRSNLFIIIEKLRQLNEKSDIAIECADKAIEHFDNIKKYNINNINRELDEIEIFLNKNVDKINILKMLLMPQIMAVIMDFKYIGKIDETEREQGKRSSERIKVIYERIKKVIEKVVPELENTVKKLDGDVEGRR
jgi:hypothetical protein